MSKNFIFLGTENIPETPSIIVSGKLNHQELIALHQKLSHKEIIWLCEESVVLPNATENYLAEQHAEAASFSAHDRDLARVGHQLLEDMGKDGVAIFLPGKANALKGTASHVETSTLEALFQLDIPITPLAVHSSEETSLKTSTNVSFLLAKYP